MFKWGSHDRWSESTVAPFIWWLRCENGQCSQTVSFWGSRNIIEDDFPSNVVSKWRILIVTQSNWPIWYHNISLLTYLTARIACLWHLKTCPIFKHKRHAANRKAYVCVWVFKYLLHAHTKSDYIFLFQASFLQQMSQSHLQTTSLSIVDLPQRFQSDVESMKDTRQKLLYGSGSDETALPRGNCRSFRASIQI